jgi:heterotetrameric sarcosine oxidase gamma subunit
MVEEDFRLASEDCAILQADGWAGNLAAFEASLSGQLGATLPAAVGETVGIGGSRVIRVAPRRFWLVGDRQDALSMDPELGSLISLAEGRMRLRMAGARLFEILNACVAIDWLSPAASPGRAVQTSFHHVPVLLIRADAQECDLIVPRSFAKSLMDWVSDVAASLDRPTKAAATRASR